MSKHAPLTRFVAYPSPSSLGPYQPTASLRPDLCSLSEQSGLAAPIDPRARRAPVELVFAVSLPARSLAPGTAREAHLAQHRSRGTLPLLIVFAGGTCLELIPQEVGLSVAVVFVGAVIVGIAVAAAVAPGSDEVGGSNHSVMTQGTSVESFDSWWGSVMATRRDSTGSAFG